MILVIGETFKNLRPCQIGKTIRNQAINCLAILEQPNDIMHANACAFDTSLAPAHPVFFHNVSVTLTCCSHIQSYHIPFRATMSFG